jgi:hypothetical protein
LCNEVGVGLCVTWARFHVTTSSDFTAQAGCQSNGWLAYRLIYSTCHSGGSLLPKLQINLHPTMLQLTTEVEANRGERSITACRYQDELSTKEEYSATPRYRVRMKGLSDTNWDSGTSVLSLDNTEFFIVAYMDTRLGKPYGAQFTTCSPWSLDNEHHGSVP